VNRGPQIETFVFDSWAVIAWLQGEPQGEVVRDLIGCLEGDEEAKGKVERLIASVEACYQCD